jgi:hypothetical protein
MKNPLTTKAETPWGRTGTLLCATVLSGVLLAGCGGAAGDDSPAEGPAVAESAVAESAVAGSATREASGQDSDEAGDTSADDLPEGFPTEVPLPEYSSAKELGTASGPLENWSVLLTVSPPSETPVEDYAALLVDAGYTVEDGPGGSIDAEGPVWDVSFHSSLSGTVSITVMES